VILETHHGWTVDTFGLALFDKISKEV